jgi:hypothetical protein
MLQGVGLREKSAANSRFTPITQFQSSNYIPYDCLSQETCEILPRRIGRSGESIGRLQRIRLLREICTAGEWGPERDANHAPKLRRRKRASYCGGYTFPICPSLVIAIIAVSGLPDRPAKILRLKITKLSNAHPPRAIQDPSSNAPPFLFGERRAIICRSKSRR